MTKDARMLTGIAWNVVVEYAVLMAATIAMGYYKCRKATHRSRSMVLRSRSIFAYVVYNSSIQLFDSGNVIIFRFAIYKCVQNNGDRVGTRDLTDLITHRV